MMTQKNGNGATPEARKSKRLWEELSALADRAQKKGIRNLSADELARLDRLYRVTSVHLAQAQTRGADHSLASDLNQLVARVHSLIYAAPRTNPLTVVLHFYAVGFARAVARTAPYHLAAAVLLLAGIGVGFYAADSDPNSAYAFAMRGDVRMPGSSPDQLEHILRSGRDEDAGFKTVFMSFLFTNNTSVGFKAFALGILCGVPTVFLLLTNGAMLGSFAAIHHNKDITWELWAWLLPHGITELGAIVLCGGAGFMLGMAVIRPGRYTRREALLLAGREALRLALGVVPMFLLAAYIESFVRQSNLDIFERIEVAAATAILWAAYFGVGAWLEHVSPKIPRRTHQSLL